MDVRQRLTQVHSLEDLQNLEESLEGQTSLELRTLLALERAKLLLEGSPDNFQQDNEDFQAGSVFNGKFVRLISVKNTYVKKFKTRGRDFRVHFKQNVFERDLKNILAFIYAGMSEILDFVFRRTKDNAMARFVMLSPYFDPPVSVRYQPRSQITPEVIFSHLENILPSNREFVLDDTLRIHVLITEIPGGTGNTTDEHSPSVPKKRSCTNCCSGENDFMCLSRAIVIGSKLQANPNYRNYARQKLFRQPDWKNHIEEQEKLHKEAGVEIAPREYTLTDVEKFQQALFNTKKLFVFEKDNRNVTCVFTGNADRKAEPLFLLLEKKHFSFIININAFLPGKRKFCSVCSKIYSRRQELQHLECRDTCVGCFFQSCVPTDRPSQGHATCTQCKRFFNSKECFEKHNKVAPGKKKSACQLICQCEKCFIEMETSEKNKHECETHFCKNCKETYSRQKDQEHVCHIQRKAYNKIDRECVETGIELGGDSYLAKVLESSKRHFFFDVETEIISGCHKPILIVMQDEGGEEKAFYGVNCCEQFCKEVFSKKYENSVFLSHGGRSYDNFFPLSYCYKHSIVPDVIFAGCQVLQLKIPDYNIVFKDNLSFILRPLSDLPKTMGLDIKVQKGFFPYKMRFPHTRFHKVSLPSEEMFCVETMKKERREEFLKWYNTKRDSGKPFDYFSELGGYCSQDVRILRLACLQFRKFVIQHCLLDPYVESLTLAHLCSLIYKKNFLEKDSIAIIPHQGFKHAKRFSLKSIQWLEYISKETGRVIFHQLNGGERIILGHRVDGFSPKQGDQKPVVYEFAGCFFHGHPSHYNSNKKNTLNQKTFGQLFTDLMRKASLYQENGFEFVLKWECEFDKDMKENPSLNEYLESRDFSNNLEPGDALYGGRNEVFNLYKKCVTPSQQILFQDFMSLYPAVMCKEKYPLGPPSRIKLFPKNEELYSFFGVAKVRVLPPRDLWIPVLPFRNQKGEKIGYIVCKTC